MKPLHHKVALITGSSRGIGKAIAERYALLGADIVVNYTSNKTAADKVVAFAVSQNVRAIAVQADVSKVKDIEHLFKTTKKHFSKVDIVVVNAGLELTGLPSTDFTEEQFDRLFDTNTKGAFFTMQAAVKNISDFGRIIYVGSSTTGYPRPGYAIHGGSKTAPLYLVQVMAQEVGKKGITVNAIIPTAIEGAGLHTDVTDDAPIKKFIAEFCPMGRMGTPEDIANVAEFFASDLSSFVSGQQLLVSGGGVA
ncbi:SDR family oxidoreductase [Marinilongibacter aquaticus]|uniref:SDR family oxidoreductase n=1 Tax=Marinilongibacter aquaticus TaxID=2975157 RepID=UPI0021BD4AF9|nr:SDR family oxidoreductase [Marinilongibacter aquaticus]UBM58778.1 SDR family oxidoreductase [Marinilongibacter aquaticus]